MIKTDNNYLNTLHESLTTLKIIKRMKGDTH